jgi:biofilm PGA synthesis N-glycosyltransferase PgaC
MKPYAPRDILLFTDARQEIEREALRYLVENFADPSVGCVSGELMLGDPHSGEATTGMGLYWRVEKRVRELESASGSVVGATGALYAARKEFLAPLPPDTILDDVYLPMQVARQQARVVFDSRARAWDAPNLGGRREFARKVRTLSGNYQLLQLAPWLLTGANPLRFEFVSHKLLRLVMPFALALAFLSAAFLRHPLYRVALGAQAGFYLLSILPLFRVKLGPLQRLADAACTFVILNAAALVAFSKFVTRRPMVWLPLPLTDAEVPRVASSKGGR